MTTGVVTRSTVTPSAAVPGLTFRRVLGSLLVGQFAIFLIPLVVLGSAINWPASLGDPATTVLPRIAEQASAVTIGYTGYFVSALLLLPIAVLLGHLFTGRAAAWLVSLSMVLGSVASIAKLLGIARWLLVMPVLATIYLDPAADAATQSAALVVYQGFNSYAGGVGELLGVALFSGLWTLAAALMILRTGLLPRWQGWFGLFAAVCSLALSLELVGLEFSSTMLIAHGVIWQLWMIIVGFTLLFRRAPQPNAPIA